MSSSISNLNKGLHINLYEIESQWNQINFSYVIAYDLQTKHKSFSAKKLIVFVFDLSTVADILS